MCHASMCLCTNSVTPSCMSPSTHLSLYSPIPNLHPLMLVHTAYSMAAAALCPALRWPCTPCALHSECPVLPVPCNPCALHSQCPALRVPCTPCAPHSLCHALPVSAQPYVHQLMPNASTTLPAAMVCPPVLSLTKAWGGPWLMQGPFYSPYCTFQPLVHLGSSLTRL